MVGYCQYDVASDACCRRYTLAGEKCGDVHAHDVLCEKRVCR